MGILQVQTGLGNERCGRPTNLFMKKSGCPVTCQALPGGTVIALSVTDVGARRGG